ncbi:MAG: DUF1559 domain-containing protein [Tepidisphaeraceae bacterium]
MADDGKIRFNLIHLIVIVGCVLFAIGLLLPARRYREPANRIKCSSNLRQIGLAMKMYANGETRTMSFPRTRWSPETADRPVFFTRPSATQPFADDGPLPNDVTAAMFLVLRTQEITADVFLCPDDKSAGERFTVPAGKTIQSFSNFTAQNQLSYSMQNPYPTKAAYDAGFKWNDEMNADFAIMADKNPGVGDILKVSFTDSGTEQQKTNSLDHYRAGQNVLYADGHVDWSVSPWAGANQNHIYGHDRVDAAAATQPASPPLTPIGIVGPPGGPIDSVLLPTAETKVP